MSVHVTLPAGAVRIDPGEVVELVAVVHNTGRAPDHLAFEVVGTPSSWTTVDPPALTLDPAATAAVRLRFRPPRAAHIRAGEAPFGLLVVAHDSRTTALSEGLLLVGRFDHTQAELVPPLLEGRRGTYRLEVENRGNVTVHLVTRAHEVDDSIAVCCRPRTLTLRPGGTASCRVDVRSLDADRTAEGSTFRVIAEAAGAFPIAVIGTLLPPPRRWRPAP